MPSSDCKAMMSIIFRIFERRTFPTHLVTLQSWSDDHSETPTPPPLSPLFSGIPELSPTLTFLYFLLCARLPGGCNHTIATWRDGSDLPFRPRIGRCFRWQLARYLQRLVIVTQLSANWTISIYIYIYIYKCSVCIIYNVVSAQWCIYMNKRLWQAQI